MQYWIEMGLQLGCQIYKKNLHETKTSRKLYTKKTKKKQKKTKKVVENICTISRDEIGCSVNNICLHLLLRKHKINDLSCVPKM